MSITTVGGKTKMSSTSSPTGLRHRRNQRADAHQVALAETASSASLEEPPSRPPLQQLPSPPAASGRRKVITVHSAVDKLDVPTLPFINLDGSSSPPPSSPTSPPSPTTPSPIPSSPTSPPSPTTPSPTPSSPTSPPSVDQAGSERTEAGESALPAEESPQPGRAKRKL